MSEKRLDPATVLRLAAGLLREAADQFANHGCNDWEPKGLTTEQDKLLGELAHEANGSPSDEKPEPLRSDWFAMITMAYELERIAEVKLIQ